MKSYLYIIYSRLFDRYYIGYSSNPWNRLIQHNTNTKDKYTGRSTDWELKSIFQLERFIKKQKSRKLIERMCQPDFVGTDRLAQLVRVPHVRD